MTGFRSNSKYLWLNFAIIALSIACSKPVPMIDFENVPEGADGKVENGNNENTDGGDENTGGGDSAGEKGTADEGSKGGSNGNGMSESEEPSPPIPEKPKDTMKDPVVPPVKTPKENVMALDNFRWELPCGMMEGTEICFSASANPPNPQFPNIVVDKKILLGGASTDLYEVELKFRGVVEPMKYKDGMRVGDRFLIGGSPDNPTYNIYSIEVSNPKQIYYLNWAQDVGHDTFAVNYTAKIKMNGGATVRLVGDGQNDKMIANFKNAMAPEITKLPNDNKGQFLQMNVVEAVLVK